MQIRTQRRVFLSWIWRRWPQLRQQQFNWLFYGETKPIKIYVSFSCCLFSSLILIRLWRLDLQVNKYVRFDSPRVSNPRCIADCQNLLTYPPAMFCFCVSQRIFKLRCCFCIFVIKLLVLFVNAVCDFFVTGICTLVSVSFVWRFLVSVYGVNHPIWREPWRSVKFRLLLLLGRQRFWRNTLYLGDRP